MQTPIVVIWSLTTMLPHKEPNPIFHKGTYQDITQVLSHSRFLSPSSQSIIPKSNELIQRLSANNTLL